ncbi:hypothetical protein FVE85_6476 [Porphyridium purpureum]|uniref:ZW10 C-terminal helical domain-containing protein n=1 Tax=Porphyridium purpureum TaxID=35688 RepID=A0A5J4Z4U8_PORPP|nr:hypothetical protein FVE85_6476 [Porphyridium purpureum]|eukprot:POR7314..scf295_1
MPVGVNTMRSHTDTTEPGIPSANEDEGVIYARLQSARERFSAVADVGRARETGIDGHGKSTVSVSALSEQVDSVLSEQQVLLDSVHRASNTLEQSLRKVLNLVRQGDALHSKTALLDAVLAEMSVFELVSEAMRKVRDLNAGASQQRLDLKLGNETRDCVQRALNAIGQGADDYPYALLEDAREYLQSCLVQISSQSTRVLEECVQVSTDCVRISRCSQETIQLLCRNHQIDEAVQRLVARITADEQLNRAILFSEPFLCTEDGEAVLIEWGISQDSVNSNTSHHMPVNPPPESWCACSGPASMYHSDQMNVLSERFGPDSDAAKCTDLLNLGARLSIVACAVQRQLDLAHAPRALRLLRQHLRKWVVDRFLSRPLCVLGSTANDAIVQWAMSEKLITDSESRHRSRPISIKQPMVAPELFILRADVLAAISDALSLFCFPEDATQTEKEHDLALVVSATTAPELLKRTIAEVRAQLALFSSQAIESFVENSGSESSSMDRLAVAPMSSAWVSPEARQAGYFGSCLVSACVLDVAAVVQAASSCADRILKRAKGKSASASSKLALASAMIGMAKEVMDQFHARIPVQFADELGASLRLQLVFHNDCLMLANLAAYPTFRLPPALNKVLSSMVSILHVSVGESMASVQQAATLRVMSNSGLQSVLDNGALEHVGGTLTRMRVDSALSRSFDAARDTIKLAAMILNADSSCALGERLCVTMLDAIIRAVLNLAVIGTDECDALTRILDSTVRELDAIRSQTLLPQALAVVEAAQANQLSFAHLRLRASLLCEILQERMANIVKSFLAGRYKHHFSAEQVSALILAIFEDTDNRMIALAQLHDPLSAQKLVGAGIQDSAEMSLAAKQPELSPVATAGAATVSTSASVLVSDPTVTQPMDEARAVEGWDWED